MRDNKKIADNFGVHCKNYDTKADVQKQVAVRLASFLPDKKQPKILEIGCGTGFLTNELFQKYPDGEFHITDLSEDMLNYCQRKMPNDNAQYFVMDGENPLCDDDYDLVISSMTFQWFDNPLETLQRLSKKGDVYFSALGQNNFKEWKAILKEYDLHDRTISLSRWPNILDEDIIQKEYEDGFAFVKMLKETGMSSSISNQYNYDYKKFKKALSAFESQISWHIVYGFQPRDNTIISAS